MAYKEKDIVEALRRTKGAIYLAADSLGCSPQTIYNWIEKSAKVKEIIDSERGKFLDVTELKLYQAVNRGEPWSIPFVLRTIGRHRGYVEKTEVESTNTHKFDLEDDLMRARERLKQKLKETGERLAGSQQSISESETE